MTNWGSHGLAPLWLGGKRSREKKSSSARLETFRARATELARGPNEHGSILVGLQRAPQQGARAKKTATGGEVYANVQTHINVALSYMKLRLPGSKWQVRWVPRLKSTP